MAAAWPRLRHALLLARLSDSLLLSTHGSAASVANASTVAAMRYSDGHVGHVPRFRSVSNAISIPQAEYLPAAVSATQLAPHFASRRATTCAATLLLPTVTFVASALELPTHVAAPSLQAAVKTARLSSESTAHCAGSSSGSGLKQTAWQRRASCGDSSRGLSVDAMHSQPEEEALQHDDAHRASSSSGGSGGGSTWRRSSSGKWNRRPLHDDDAMEHDDDDVAVYKTASRILQLAKEGDLDAAMQAFNPDLQVPATCQSACQLQLDRHSKNVIVTLLNPWRIVSLCLCARHHLAHLRGGLSLSSSDCMVKVVIGRIIEYLL